MSASVQSSEKSRHLVVRIPSGQTLPGAIVDVLREEGVACGWLRASGVLADVELRAYDAQLGTLGSTRRIEGVVQALAVDGSIGLVAGEPSVSLRAVVARETDRGLETLAGEIESARTVALEAIVTVLDDVTLERALDAGAGVWLLGQATAAPAAPRAPRPQAPAAPAAWSSALEASEPREPAERPRYTPGAAPAATVSAPIPQRPARPHIDLDTAAPEPGDGVEHFAFGRADVMKSDGDRLHLRVHKDGRIREIALEMLRVTRLPDDDDGRRRFKLERRM